MWAHMPTRKIVYATVRKILHFVLPTRYKLESTLERPLFCRPGLARTDASKFAKEQCEIKFGLKLNQVRPSYRVFYNPYLVNVPQENESNILEVVKRTDENGTHSLCQKQLCPVV